MTKRSAATELLLSNRRRWRRKECCLVAGFDWKWGWICGCYWRKKADRSESVGAAMLGLLLEAQISLEELAGWR